MRTIAILLTLCMLLLCSLTGHVQASETWTMSFDPSIGSIGDVVTLHVSLQEKSGRPINNAIVTWSDDGITAFLTHQDAAGEWSKPASKVIVDSAIDHVNSGIYQSQVKLTQAGHVRVQVATQSGEVVYDTSAYVLGSDSYSVAVVSQPMLATVPQQFVDIIVVDKAGAQVTTLDALKVEGVGVSASLANAKLADFDGDGKVDGYRVAANPTSVGDVTVLAAMGKGNNYGKSTAIVLAPPVTVSPVGVLTDSWLETLTLESTLKDKDGERVAFRYRIRGEGASFSVQGVSEQTGQQGYQQFYQGLSNQVVHELDFTPSATSTGSLAKIIVEASFNGEHWAEVTQFVLRPLTIEVNKPTLIMGTANWVQARIINGRGEPLAMAEVQLLDGWGLTDSLGSVTLLVTPTTIDSYPLRVRTSVNTYVEKIIRVGDASASAPQPQKRITLKLGSANQSLGMDQPPLLVGGRVLLPFRWFGETVLGARVDYYMEQGREIITLERERTRITLILGERRAYINGQGVSLDAAPLVSGGRTLVPARFLAETFGYTVTWLEENNQVIIEER